MRSWCARRPGLRAGSGRRASSSRGTPGRRGDRRALEPYAGRRIAVGVRPEHLGEAASGAPARLTGRVLLVEALGAASLARDELRAPPLDRPELVDTIAPQAPLLGEATATVRARLAHDTRVR